ncbi:hypothetical protein GW17_00033051, partial [Ensete ventricosum]
QCGEVHSVPISAMSRLNHVEPASSARPDLGVSSDGPAADQLSPLLTGGAVEPTCQTSPPDPRQLATSSVSGQT